MSSIGAFPCTLAFRLMLAPRASSFLILLFLSVLTIVVQLVVNLLSKYLQRGSVLASNQAAGLVGLRYESASVNYDIKTNHRPIRSLVSIEWYYIMLHRVLQSSGPPI